MKKIIMLLLFVLMTVTIAGCGKKKTQTTEVNTAVTSENTGVEGADNTENASIEDLYTTWTYAEERPLMICYEFKEDGTWSMWGDGGATDEGKFETEDNLNLVLHSDMGSGDLHMTYENGELVTEYGSKLKVYTPEE